MFGFNLLGQAANKDYTPWTKWEGSGYWFPTRASSFGDDVDFVYDLILWTSVVFFALIVIPMVYFVMKYRKRPGYKKESSPDHNLTLEIAWSAFPTLILIVFFVKGVWGYMDMETIPDDAYQINVTASQFAWEFQYPNGDINSQLYLPLNKPVKFRLQSRDVLHSFFLVEMRQKMDVVPGRYTWTWVRPIKEGQFRLYCSEYCGDGHSLMRRDVFVLPTMEDVEKKTRWVEKEHTPVENGERLFALNCSGCHSIEPGVVKTGPSLGNAWGTTRKTSAGDVKFDEAYLTESVYEPGVKIAEVNGSIPASSQMPSFKGKINAEQIKYLAEYFKSKSSAQ